MDDLTLALIVIGKQSLQIEHLQQQVFQMKSQVPQQPESESPNLQLLDSGDE